MSMNEAISEFFTEEEWSQIRSAARERRLSPLALIIQSWCSDIPFNEIVGIKAAARAATPHNPEKRHVLPRHALRGAHIGDTGALLRDGDVVTRLLNRSAAQSHIGAVAPGDYSSSDLEALQAGVDQAMCAQAEQAAGDTIQPAFGKAEGLILSELPRIVEAMPDSLTNAELFRLAFDFEWDKEAPWYNHAADRLPSGKPWWGKSFDRELIGNVLIKYVLNLRLPKRQKGEDDAAYDARADKLVNEPFTRVELNAACLRGLTGAVPTPERDLEVLCGLLWMGWNAPVINASSKEVAWPSQVRPEWAKHIADTMRAMRIESMREPRRDISQPSAPTEAPHNYLTTPPLANPRGFVVEGLPVEVEYQGAPAADGWDHIAVDQLLKAATVYNPLINAGIETVGHLVRLTEAELKKVPRLGAKSITAIKDALKANGLSLTADAAPASAPSVPAIPSVPAVPALPAPPVVAEAPAPAQQEVAPKASEPAPEQAAPAPQQQDADPDAVLGRVTEEEFDFYLKLLRGTDEDAAQLLDLNTARAKGSACFRLTASLRGLDLTTLRDELQIPSDWHADTLVVARLMRAALRSIIHLFKRSPEQEAELQHLSHESGESVTWATIHLPERKLNKSWAAMNRYEAAGYLDLLRHEVGKIVERREEAVNSSDDLDLGDDIF